MGSTQTPSDATQHPAYYNKFGAEVIEIAGYLNFARGSVVKYVARAGLKNPNTELEDLLKARNLLDWEIKRVQESHG